MQSVLQSNTIVQQSNTIVQQEGTYGGLYVVKVNTSQSESHVCLVREQQGRRRVNLIERA